MSDSEDTLSALSDIEMVAEVDGKVDEPKGVAGKKRPGTQRRKKGGSSNTKKQRSSSGSGDVRVLGGADASNSAPTRTLKATQARKLLAKVLVKSVCLF